MQRPSDSDSDPNERRVRDIEQRLRAYYGPARTEQPLSSASWFQLQARLKPRRFVFSLRRLRRMASVGTLPPSVMQAYEQIAARTYLAYPARIVYCRYQQRRSPHVRVQPWRHRAIRLVLPRHETPTSAELAVLLASGLTRYHIMRRSHYLWLRLLPLALLPGLWLIAGGLLIGTQLAPTVVLVIVSLLTVVFGLLAGWMLDKQGRALAQAADAMMVNWLGREQVCLGLHCLAGRNSHAGRRVWCDLSLEERINNLCGISVPQIIERVPLAR